MLLDEQIAYWNLFWNLGFAFVSLFASFVFSALSYHQHLSAEAYLLLPHVIGPLRVRGEEKRDVKREEMKAEGRRELNREAEGIPFGHKLQIKGFLSYWCKIIIGLWV